MTIFSRFASKRFEYFIFLLDSDFSIFPLRQREIWKGRYS